MKEIEILYDFFQKINRLKFAYRFSYTDKLEGNTPVNDSSAGHSWRLAMMALILHKKLSLDINLEHSLKIILVHDLAESITGDYDAYAVSIEKLSKVEKEKSEYETMKNFANIDSEIFELWKEYEESKTEEAKFVKALDKIETLSHYIDADYKVIHGPEFIYSYADKAVKNYPKLKPLLDKIKEELINMFKRKNILLQTKI